MRDVRNEVKPSFLNVIISDDLLPDSDVDHDDSTFDVDKVVPVYKQTPQCRNLAISAASGGLSVRGIL